MKPLKSIKVLFWDHGLFVDLATRMAKDVAKVYYYCPNFDPWPKVNPTMIGYGLEGVTPIQNPWEIIKTIDLCVFPDTGFGDIQLQIKAMGIPVWGTLSGEELELDRELCKEVLGEVGLPVGPYQVVKGVKRLREVLKSKKDQFVKISQFRGQGESFFAKDYKSVEPKLDKLEYDLGPLKDTQEFDVEAALPDRIELGTDAYTVDGALPSKSLFGIEIKDCYDDQTEILTNSGWKFFRDLDKSESVLTMNRSEIYHPFLEYQKPVKWIDDDYSGKMLSIESQNISLLVTPNHNLLISRGLQNPDGKILEWTGFDGIKRAFRRGKRETVLVKASDIDLTKWFKMTHPKSVFKSNRKKQTYFQIGKTKIPFRKFSAMLAMYISEGYCRNRKGVYETIISQFKYREQFREVLMNLGLGFKENKQGFVSYNKELGEYLIKFGKSRDKYIPDEIKHAGVDSIRTFLYWYAMGDGSFRKFKDGDKSSRIFYTNSIRIRDDLQDLITKIGNPSICSHKDTKWGRQYFVSERIEQRKNWILPHQTQWKNYSGRIYCVTVPNHIICVRRNGKVCWSGNSGYVGQVKAMEDFPTPLQKVDKAFQGIFKGYDYRMFYSTECRIGKDGKPYMIDFTARMGNPPWGLYTLLYKNISNIIWSGANGQLVDPEVNAKFGAILMIKSEWANKENWCPVDYPSHLRDFIRISNGCIIDKQHYSIPLRMGLKEIGCVLGMGDTLQEAMDSCVDNSKHLGGVDVDVDPLVFEDAQKEIEKAEEFGIKLFE
jgi:hypothetical protein